jgi:hypothetical protein
MNWEIFCPLLFFGRDCEKRINSPLNIRGKSSVKPPETGECFVGEFFNYKFKFFSDCQNYLFHIGEGGVICVFGGIGKFLLSCQVFICREVLLFSLILLISAK